MVLKNMRKIDERVVRSLMFGHNIEILHFLRSLKKKDSGSKSPKQEGEGRREGEAGKGMSATFQLND